MTDLFDPETRLYWPDNTCTVGWTSIHGYFTFQDMDWLEANVEGGYLTSTRYGMGSERKLSLYRDHLKESDSSKRWPCYYTFPMLPNMAFVALLRVSGLIPSEGVKGEEGKLRHGAWLERQLKEQENE